MQSFFKQSQIQKQAEKSDNLQYNMLGCWVAGRNDKCLMFQVLFFFIISCKTLYGYNLFSYIFL